MKLNKKIATNRRNTVQKEKALPLEMGSGSTPGPLLTVFRLCRPRVVVPTEVVTSEKLRALKNLMTAQVMNLERENFPGSWAWRNPARGR